MIDQEKSNLRNLIRDPRWKTIEDLKDKVIENLNSHSVVKETMDETARAAITKEAKIEAIRDFIQEIYTQAQ